MAKYAKFGFIGMIAHLLIGLPAITLPAMAQETNRGEIICAATHTFQGREITVSRFFKPDGTEVIDGYLDSEKTRSSDGVDEAKIRAQLYDYVTWLLPTSSKDCSTYSPDKGYEIHVFDCSMDWQVGGNSYSVTANSLKWRYQDGADWDMSLRGFFGKPIFLTSGFSALFSISDIVVNVARPAAWPQAHFSKIEKSREIMLPRTEVVEIRSGAYKRRAWTASYNMLNLTTDDWQQISRGDNEVSVLVYDTAKGTLLQKTFPATFFADVEAQLKAGYLSMVDKAVNDVTSCKRLDSWYEVEAEAIVVT
jgi:hypothetical protein